MIKSGQNYFAPRLIAEYELSDVEESELYALLEVWANRAVDQHTKGG